MSIRPGGNSPRSFSSEILSDFSCDCLAHSSYALQPPAARDVFDVLRQAFDCASRPTVGDRSEAVLWFGHLHEVRDFIEHAGDLVIAHDAMKLLTPY